MIDILSKPIYKLDDEVYCIISSVDKPHLFIKCRCKILHRIVKKDNVVYAIKLTKLYINAEDAKVKLHRRVFKTKKADSEVAVMKTLYCLQYIDEPEKLSLHICEDLTDYMFVLPSVFVCDDINELNKLYEDAIETTASKLKSMLFELENTK